MPCDVRSRSIAPHVWPGLLTLAFAAALLDACAQAPAVVAQLRVEADGIPAPLGGARGDPQRGRSLMLARDAANCILCHAWSDAGARFAGNVGPALDGVGSRLSAAQLRLRIADNTRVNPRTVMPSYHRTDGLADVARAYRGKPILSAAQVEDLVAFLSTLK